MWVCEWRAGRCHHSCCSHSISNRNNLLSYVQPLLLFLSYSYTWRVILKMIAVFLFTRQFRKYPILRVKPTAYGITFFRTLSWWVVGRVVVCGCALLSCYGRDKLLARAILSYCGGKVYVTYKSRTTHMSIDKTQWTMAAAAVPRQPWCPTPGSNAQKH
jgi:hypothetical protein